MAFRPDIIVLVLDTQRVDRLSCYGYTHETSPYLDAIAQDSSLFRHGVAAAQWTIPSHTSMFTGLYPSEHGTIQSWATWLGRYKFIQTGSDKQELYDILSDPEETVDLSMRLPEQTKLLQQSLATYVPVIRDHPLPATTTASTAQPGDKNPSSNHDDHDTDDEDFDNYNDPQVQRRLRDLGYLG